jgi:hypothetical protein
VTLVYARDMGGEAAVTLRYIGSRFEDDLNQQRLDDALTVGVRALVPIYGPLQAELRAENIMGSRVEAAISGAGLVERATPRSVWAGLRFAFF